MDRWINGCLLTLATKLGMPVVYYYTRIFGRLRTNPRTVMIIYHIKRRALYGRDIVTFCILTGFQKGGGPHYDCVFYVYYLRIF